MKDILKLSVSGLKAKIQIKGQYKEQHAVFHLPESDCSSKFFTLRLRNRTFWTGSLIKISICKRNQLLNLLDKWRGVKSTIFTSDIKWSTNITPELNKLQLTWICVYSICVNTQHSGTDSVRYNPRL